MTKYDVLLGLLIIQLTSGLVGNHFGYAVNSVPQGATAATANPGLLGIVDYLWDSGVFLFNMTTFRVDGMPVFVSAIFTIMAILVVFIIINIVRGND